METINLNQLTVGEGGAYLFGEVPFSGFAIEIFPDGRLATQIALMRGARDGSRGDGTSPTGISIESEKSCRTGHGWRREWNTDGVLKTES